MYNETRGLVNKNVGYHIDEALYMSKPIITIAVVNVVIAGNVLLVAFFIWLAFSPPVFYGEHQNMDLSYLVIALYPLVNFLALKYLGYGSGIAKAIWWIMFSLNALLLIGAVVFGYESATEIIYSEIEKFVTLWLLIPPLLTVIGFIAQYILIRKMSNNSL